MFVSTLAALSFAMSNSREAYAQQTASAVTEKAPTCTAAPIAPGQPWKLEYRFGGGIMPGTGTVDLLLSSDGTAVMTLTRRQHQPTVKTVTIPDTAIAKIAKTLTKWPPECIHTRLRKGYIVYDNGSYSIKFTSGASSASALIDACHFVDNGDAFTATYDAIQSLAPFVGKEIAWSSGVSTSVKSDECAPGSAAPN